MENTVLHHARVPQDQIQIFSLRVGLWTDTGQGNQMAAQLGKHLQDVGESYDEHFVHAGRYGLVLIGAGFACLVHAVLPFLFEKTGSQCVSKLYAHMANRGRVTPEEAVRA